MKILKIPYLALGLSMTLLAPASAASYGNRGGGGSYRGSGNSVARSSSNNGSAFRNGNSHAVRSSGLRASSTRPGFAAAGFSQRSGPPRFGSSINSNSTRTSASRGHEGNHWQNNRNYGSASAWRGGRDWNHDYRGDYRHSGNRYSHYGRGYYPYYYGGSFPGYWSSSYSYYPISRDYPDSYYDDDDAYYYSEDPGYDAAYSRPVYHDASAPTAAQIQRRLAAEGYYDGSIDGTIGPRTRAAIRAYERDHGLQITGAITKSLLRALRLA